MLHIALHFIIPAIVVGLFFRHKWHFNYLIIMSTVLVDLDHLLADPIYSPTRCSIGFHPLHGFIPIAIYGLLCLPSRTRLIGIGLVIHMLLDFLDCLLI
ncbi:MAG: hypothetical protein GY820_44945 [Gammaproteobacteria bacterium]|nr:hypothetical protein [Gammaproteobacteria bacterium]